MNGAPRVTEQDMAAAIKSTVYVTGDYAFPEAFASGSEDDRAKLRTTTLCWVTLHNGFTVLGKSALVSPANFVAEDGRKYALENAVDQLWQVMGYALQDRLYRQAAGSDPNGAKAPVPPGALPLYRSHKMVRAVKISFITKHAHSSPAYDDAVFEASDEFQGACLFHGPHGEQTITVDAAWYRKHDPVAGGYYVVYADGYASFSPAEAFEGGYVEVTK